MTDTSFATDNELTVQLYSELLYREAGNDMWMKKFIGKTPNDLYSTGRNLRNVQIIGMEVLPVIVDRQVTYRTVNP